MKRLILCLIVLLLIQATTALAFDGRRKGFVLGGGLGFGPVAKATLDGFDNELFEKSGMALNFVIGYAPNEQDMIVFLRDAVVYSIWGLSYVQGFSGVGWFHYFGPQGKSAYITGGLGLQDWTLLESGGGSADAGLGLLIGGGYEFSRHVQVHGSLSFGKTSAKVNVGFGTVDFDYNHTQLLFTISAMAF